MAVDATREVSVMAHPGQNAVMGWSPNGTQLLVASDRAGSMGLWAVPMANGAAHGTPALLKSNFGTFWSLGVTTRGTLFTWKGGDGSYVKVNAIDWKAGTLARPTIDFEEFVGSRGRPDWSADGKQLSMVSCGGLGGGPCTLRIHSFDQGMTRELKPGLWYFAFPRWSPDGKALITDGSDLKGRHGIYRIDADTGEASYVVDGSQPDWAPDGRHIYYVAGNHSAPRIVERELLSGSERAFPTPVAQNWMGLTVSRDGRACAFVSMTATTSSVVLLPLAGGEPRTLWQASSPATLAPIGFVPDQHSVVVVRETTGALLGPKELWLVPEDGGQPRKLDIDVDKWEIPGLGFRVHPDGRHVVYMASAGGDATGGISALENFLPTAHGAQ